MRRIGCLYSDSPDWPKFRWVHQALERLGHTVYWIRGREDLLVADETCDLVLMQHKAVIRWPNLRDIAERKRAPWVQWWFDLVALDPGKPLADQAYLRTFLPLMQACDAVLVKERSLLDDYWELGIRAHWCDQGCPADMPAIVPGRPKWDVLLWGQAGADYRQRAGDAVAIAEAGYRVAWATRGGNVPPGIERLPWCSPLALPQLAAKARYCLAVDRRHDLNGYWSDRLWMATGMGASVLRRETPGLPDGPYLVYRNHAELVGHLEQDHDEGLGQQAREWTMQHHTYEHRVQWILDLLTGASTAAAPAD